MHLTRQLVIFMGLALALAACSSAKDDTPAALAAADGDNGDGANLSETVDSDGSSAGKDTPVVEDTAPDVPPPPADLPPPPDAAPAKDVQQSATEKLTACLLINCTDQITTCLGDPGCGDAVGCLAGCAGDSACMLKCAGALPPAAQQELTSVATCAVQQGCVQIIKSPNCGNGKCDFGEQLSCAQDCGTPSSVCGDGKCDVAELLSCDVDCKAPPNPCGDGKCDPILENPFTCVKDCPPPVCGNSKCDGPWETPLTCAKDCTVGKCGNGACDMPEETTLSCAVDCAPLPLCGDGACTMPLENAFTCVKDCPLPKCGDTKCDGPFETSLNCPADCSVNGGKLINPAGCVAAKCLKESLDCGGDFMGCLSAGLCINGCADMKCVATCGAKLSATSKLKYQPLEDCVGKNCVSP